MSSPKDLIATIGLTGDFSSGCSSDGEYLELPAAEYSLGSDVDDDAVPDLVFELPELPERAIANVFAVKGGSVHLLAQLADEGVVRIDPMM